MPAPKDTLLLMKRLNARMGQRIRKRRGFYFGFNLVGSVGLAAFWWFALFGLGVDFRSEEPIHVILLFCAGLVLNLLGDLFGLLHRFGHRGAVEPFHFLLFPVGRLRLVAYHFVSSVSDSRMLFYVAPVVLFGCFFARDANLPGVFGGVLLFAALYLSVTVWMLVIYFWLGRVLFRRRAGVIALLPAMALLYNGLVVLERIELFAYVPLVNYVAYALYGFYTGSTYHLTLGVGCLALAIAAGMLLVALALTRSPRTLGWSSY